jgi:RHS repeat-associated protein
MRTNTTFCRIVVVVLSLLSFAAYGLDQPGWYEREGEHIPYGQTPAKNAQSEKSGGGGGMALLGAPDEESPEIEELARNLQNDPTLIYEFVRNKIDYVPYYGFLKGATQTLLDRAGNDADQSALLAALLRASGYTATYHYGYQYIPTMAGDEFSAARWFDVEDDADAVDRTIYRNGIPGIAYYDWTIMDRIWVEATITGQVYQLDAAFKPHTRLTPLDLASAMGYSRAALLSAAGGESTTNYARNLSETNLAQTLCNLSSNLLSVFRTSYANSEIEDIIGKSAIIPEDVDGLPTSLSFYTVATETWSDPPTNLIHTVRIQHGGIDQSFSIPEIAGKRLSITYTNDVTGSEPLAMMGGSGPTEELKAVGPGLVPTATTIPLSSGATLQAPPGWTSKRDMVVQIRVPPLADKKGSAGGGSMLLGTYSWDFGYYYNYAPYCSSTGSISPYSNPNPVTLHTHAWLENNNSGAFTIIGGGGYVDYGQYGVVTIVVRFNGCGLSYGLKSASLRLQGWYYWPTLVFDDTWNMTGYVSQEPRLSNSYGVDMGWTWLNYAVTGSCRVVNDGYTTLYLTNMYFVGPGASQFEIIGSTSYQIPSSQYRDIPVRYKATSRGTHYATNHLSFYYDGIGYEWDYLPVRGQTVYQPDFSGSYGINFGTNYYQEPAIATSVLHNAGSLSLTINSMTLVGPGVAQFEFTSGNGSGSIGAGSSRNIGVRYKAAERGTHNATNRVDFTYDGKTYTWDLLPYSGTTVSRPLAQLRLDDDLIADESTVTSGAVANLILTIDHPYSAYTNTYYDQTVTFPLKRGANYAIISDFGSSGGGRLLDSRQRKLDQYRRSGFADSSRQVLTETLNVIGQSWMRETVLSEELMNRIANVNRSYHHRFGIMAQEEGYYVDVKAQTTATTARDGDTSKESAHFRAGGLMASALEHGILEQLQGTNKPGASTVKLLEIANSTGQKIFFATSGNYASIQPQLTNYTAADLASFSNRISQGQTLILPENAQITLQEWRGKGYVAHGPGAGGYSEIGMIIDGDYYGGYGGNRGNVYVPYVSSNNRANQYQAAQTQIRTVQDPVDIASGNLAYEREDLKLGSGVPPLGLSLTRFYNSGQINLRSALGYGWHHSLDIQAQVRSEGAAGLGLRSPADAAALLVASVAIEDVVANENNAKGWAMVALVSKWASDQLNDNAVSIQIADKNLEFIRLPDGTYSPPPGSTATLCKSNGLFHLEERFGVKLDFNANGKLATWKDADNNTMSFSYNAQTNLQSVADAFSRSLTFTYSGSNLSSVADSSGRSISYSVANGNLTSAADPENFSWSFGYDTEHRLLWINDPLSQRTVSNFYSATSGKVLSQRNAASNLWNMFVVPQFRSAEQNPFGDSTVYRFDDKTRQIAQADPFGNESRTAYDGQNHVVSQLDARDNLTEHQYDTRQNRTNTIDALGHATAYSYDSQNRLVKVTDALGHQATTGYDSEHHPTNTVDAASNVTTIAYYANGLPQTVTGPRGEVTSYTYDSYGNPATIARMDGGTETRTWNARGDLLTLADANTNTTTYTYDKRRLQTSERDPYGKAVSNVYNAAGLLVTTLDKRGFSTTRTWTPTYKEKSIQYPDGGSVSNTYDAADRLAAVRDPIGFITSNRYDKAGRVTAVVNPRGFATSNVYDQTANLVSVRDPAGNVTSNQYDALNRIVKTTDALGFSVSNEYNQVGWLVANVDQEGKLTEYERDNLGRVTLERRRDLEYRFEYDAAGNRTAFINSKGIRSMTYGFDKMNRLTTATNALSQVTRFVFDPVGNLRQKVNANGQTTYFSYNAVNLVTNRQSAVENVSFGYDPNGNLTNMVDALGTTRQSFDAMNRLAKVVDPFGQTVSNAYNLAGWRTQITYPDGKTEQFSYNPNGRVSNVVGSAFSLGTTTYDYDSRDNLTGAGLPGSLSASYAYDNVNRLTSWSVSKAGSNLLSRSCTRNGLGFKETETIQAGLETLDGPASQTRAHNAADQIAGILQTSPSATNLPSFDPAGNATQVVLSAKGQTFTALYRYDYENRLLSVTRLRNGTQGQSVTTSVVQLEYDGLGLLLRITETGNVRRLVRDRADQLARPLVETDASGNTVRWFMWSNGRLLAQVQSNGIVRVALADELGRTVALTDGSGALTDEFSYLPYGRLIAHSGTTATPMTWLGGFGVWDAGHGLYLTRHRAYDANLATWLSPDPLGLSGGLNLYVYGSDNPLAFLDPLGLDTYRQNRVFYFLDPNGTATRAPLTHTFIYTTNPDGSLEHTYSWGNVTENGNGVWRMDRMEDQNAANQAIADPSVRGDWVGDDTLDPYVAQTFQDLRTDPNSPSLHKNWIVTASCKTEANRLTQQALQLQNTSRARVSSSAVAPQK